MQRAGLQRVAAAHRRFTNRHFAPQRLQAQGSPRQSAAHVDFFLFFSVMITRLIMSLILPEKRPRPGPFRSCGTAQATGSRLFRGPNVARRWTFPDRESGSRCCLRGKAPGQPEQPWILRVACALLHGGRRPDARLGLQRWACTHNRQPDIRLHAQVETRFPPAHAGCAICEASRRCFLNQESRSWAQGRRRRCEAAVRPL